MLQLARSSEIAYVAHSSLIVEYRSRCRRSVQSRAHRCLLVVVACLPLIVVTRRSPLIGDCSSLP